MYFPASIGKSPMGMVVKEGDQNWLELTRWVFNVLIAAEEAGYTSTNLPPDNWGPTIPGLNYSTGEARQSWAKDVIAAVGNYEDIWNRNLGKYGNTFMVVSSKPDLPPLNASPNAKKLWRPQTATVSRGINEVWTNGGLHYSAPF